MTVLANDNCKIAAKLSGAFSQMWMEDPTLGNRRSFDKCHRWTGVIQGQINKGMVHPTDMRVYCHELITFMSEATDLGLNGTLTYPFVIVSESMEYLISQVNKDLLIREHSFDWTYYTEWLEYTKGHLKAGLITQVDIWMFTDAVVRLKAHF